MTLMYRRITATPRGIGRPAMRSLAMRSTTGARM